MKSNAVAGGLARRVALAGLALSLASSLVLGAAPAFAQTASGQPYVDPEHAKSLIEDPADKARYKALAEELRCLVCQNQTLADSDASLAVDLRRQLETMVIEGKSDDEIKRYLVDRYGQFVLYRPPVQGNTWLLWFGPFVLLAIGIAAWVLVRRSRGPVTGAAGGSTAPTSAGSAFDMAAKASSPGLPASGAEGGEPGQVRDEDLERARRLLDGN